MKNITWKFCQHFAFQDAGSNPWKVAIESDASCFSESLLAYIQISGTLQIFDLDKAEMTEEITDAHSKEIWSMCLYADKKGFVTASADQTVKFWSFEALKVKLDFLFFA